MIWFCIPSYNEEHTVGVVLWKIRQEMAAFPRDYHILLLDDGSTDETQQVLEPYARVLPLTLIRHEKRAGYAASLRELLDEAVRRSGYPKRDAVVVLQADFSEDPADAVTLIKRLEGGADLVTTASRATDTHPSRWHRWVSRLAATLARRGVPGENGGDPLAGLRAYRVVSLRKALENRALLTTADGPLANAQLLEAVAPHARKIEEVEVDVRYDRRFRASRFRASDRLRELMRYVRTRGPAPAPVERADAASRTSTRGAATPTAAALFALALAAPLAAPVELAAQATTSSTPAVAPVPFGPGERATYEVRLGMFGDVGSGSMEILPLEQIRGRWTYPMVFRVRGRVTFARVDDRLQSWMDVGRLHSWRFKQDQKEVNFERHRTTDFYTDRMEWVRNNRITGELATDQPLDDVSFLYFVRTIPLEVGRTYSWNRYWKADGNPVTVRVLRRERITVPGGTFNTLVLQPIIQTDGMFGEGGEALIYLTDDNRRLLVKMTSRVPIIGNLTLQLESYRPGQRVLASDLD
ncbi:MAG TPA: DUF3108 domain-containing protein [Longimicrobiales bacterium]